MARPKSEWPNKVLALIQSGNHTAAVAQIKVAPTVGDITRLQTLLEKLPPSPALQQLKKFVEEERALLAAGTVRDRNEGDAVASMELEHYPGMTEKSIEAMVQEAFRRFDIFGARVIHRVGLLQPLDQIVLVAVTSAHRGQSFQACEFLMDYLKTQAPFWKKEQTPQGARWVDARVSDDAALARWGITARNA